MIKDRNSIIRGYVEAGYRLTPLRGKVPINRNWVNTEYDKSITADDIEGNFGVVLQNDDLVIDVDPRRFPQGSTTPLDALQQLIGVSFADSTFTVRTGGDGMHFYMKKHPSINIRGALKEFPGIEFKTYGQQVVGASSIHPETGKLYKVVSYPFMPCEAPQKLINLIERADISLQGGTDYNDSDDNAFRYIKYLQRTEGAIEGEGGDVHTFKVACRGRDFALSAQKTFELMAEHWNPKCIPEWDLEELKVKVSNAYKYNADVVGKFTAQNDFQEFSIEEDTIGKYEIEVAWDLNKDNTKLLPTIRNVVNYLLCKDYPFLGMLKFNEFSNDIVLTKPAPWHNGQKLGTWSDTDVINFKYWLSKVRCFNVPTSLCQEGAIVAASKFRFHPVREFLQSLTWDGKPRLDSWLNVYAGVKDNEYSRTVGAKVLIAAVGRIFNPGLKFDNMLILEGNQGIGKSTLVSILGGEWYKDIAITDSDKDTVDAMRGGWIIEVSEMVCSRKVDTAKLKSFLSKTSDRVRLAYRKNAEDYPRQSIFIGTVNPEGDGYLQDSTGNRRFWPVECTKINAEGLVQVREQLLAEAVSRYFRGEKVTLSAKVYEEANIEANKRKTADEWQYIIEDWLTTPNVDTLQVKEFVTGKDILEQCLGIPVSRFNNRELARVARIMQQLGWTRGKFYNKTKCKSEWGFRKLTNTLEDIGL